MSDALFQSPLWLEALTLAERARLGGAPRWSDPERGRARLAGWRAQPPFPRADWLARRLALDGLTEESAQLLLGEPAESLLERAGGPPAWLAEIESSFSRARTPDPLPSLGLKGRRRPELYHGVEPVLRAGLERIREGARELAAGSGHGCPFDPETVGERLLPNLARALWVPLSRTLVLELHVAGLAGELAGDTPEERFADFTERLRRPETALAFLHTYPVLARLLALWTDQWVTFSLEFLTHLAADGDRLRETFGVEGRLAAADGGAGDSHRGGRSVILLRFDSGRRLVYKPRSLAVEARFQELLDWLHQRGFEPRFRTLSVLDRGDYGWAEFVADAECASRAEVRRFYERQGGYLALLYLLDAADFHSENLIAAGEHPVLVDLEALFHPRIDLPDLRRQRGEPGEGLQRSVLRLGMLPNRIWGRPGEDGVDLSALGGAAGQMSPQPLLRLEDVGTDRMRFERQRTEMGGALNLPTLSEPGGDGGGGGGAVRLADHADDLAAGFERMMRLVLAHRDELLSPAGPLARFAGAETRVIVRPTSTYEGLLVEGFHPDVLGNALHRDALLDRLWTAVEARPFLERLISLERREIERGDVPVFTTFPGSRDLWSGTGEPIADAFDSTGLARVEDHLRGLDEREVARQLWTIRASLHAVALAGQRAPWPRRPLPEPPEPASRDRLRAAAVAVGDRLEERAFRGPEDASWLTLTTSGPTLWSVQPVGADLYEGLPGITFFLAHLGAGTGQERFTRLAREAQAHFCHQLDRSPGILASAGAFSGWGGPLYVLTHLGVLWNDPELLDRAVRWTDRLPALIETDETHDLSDGAAGCAVCLLGLHRLRPRSGLLDLARLCGERLLATAVRGETGAAWPFPPAGPVPLAGVAHGAAGAAWALLKLAAATGDQRFRQAALDAIAYERTLFLPGPRNWADLRPGSEPGEPIWGWCNGAPGIGLTRLDSLPELDDPATREEIAAAVESTLEQGLGNSHSLCHGDLGNLDFLLEAARRLGDPGLERRVYALAAGVLASVEAEGWRQGVPMGGDTPGLMAGLSGLGYGLLRLAEPDRVPSVLLLKPPPGAAGS